MVWQAVAAGGWNVRLDRRPAAERMIQKVHTEKILFSTGISTVNIDRISQCLKGIERDADRKKNIDRWKIELYMEDGQCIP